MSARACHSQPVRGIAATLFARANQSTALKNCGAFDFDMVNHAKARGLKIEKPAHYARHPQWESGAAGIFLFTA